MKAKLNGIIGASIGLLVLTAIFMAGLQAQTSARSSNRPNVTTNWVGCLVVGQRDMADPITPNPSPTVTRQVEIGLRSDGVVIWRETQETKSQ